MQFEFKIRPLAALEISEAFEWYEQQKAGLGFQFLEELENFLAALQINPYTHSYYESPVREGIIKRFPYSVVYEVINEKEIIIYSIFMAKRNPETKRTF